MIKLTVLYGHPTDPAAFESYYATTHMPLVGKIKEIEKAETTMFLDEADGSKPAYYRMAELWFSSIEELQAGMGSPEGQATARDIANFATGGVTLLTGSVE
ncbi:EthD family reductase [Arcticibacterium luteifluviistationis]|uniref:EthD family reductase n=1 Tax=Arcticibacterium luteifluviistationis TaxID=1784714 RepID=A0A2Z4GH39_9BACT|nr:EthD family reductase [Arcticibacterium luteifluviistationis]AWW00356.1 EthD family reductase [Arcticibacterium luteifluviistationis]